MDLIRRVGRTVRFVVMWLGVVMCVLLLCGWLSSGWLSGRVDVRSFPSTGQRTVGVRVSEGGVSVHEFVNPGDVSWTLLPDGWSFGKVPDAPRLLHWFRFRDASYGLITGWEFFVPLWIPLLLCVLLTTLTWYRGYPRPGYCICGYSLAGIVKSRVCPECGQSRVS